LLTDALFKKSVKFYFLYKIIPFIYTLQYKVQSYQCHIHSNKHLHVKISEVPDEKKAHGKVLHV